jgi:hypothetical protein
MRRLSVAILTLLSMGAVALGAKAVLPVGGPGPVVDLHERLFRALEDGKSDVIHGLVRNQGPEEPLLFVVDASNRPRTLNGSQAPEQWVKAWQANGSVMGSTMIKSSEILGDPSTSKQLVVILELTRAVRGNGSEEKPVVRRYRCTSILARTGSDAESYRVCHLHISPADIPAGGDTAKDRKEP